MLIEQTIIDKLEVLPSGDVQVREANQVVKDGAVIASQFHRRVISISDPDPDLSWMDDASRAVVEAARTPERLAAAAEQAELPA